MGHEEASNIGYATFDALWAGWFPGKAHNDIPGEWNSPTSPLGARECDNVAWYNGALRKIFGYSAVTTSGLNGVPTSLFYSPVLDEFVGTAGAKLYSGMDDAAPTDITGALTITGGNLVKWTEWQFETTKLVIGTNQTNVPFKWTGAGNGAALGGSPPQGKWIATWANCLWLANTTNEPSTVYFSNIGDPETWTTDDDYKFDAPIMGMAPLGDILAVFMEDHIGIVYGANVRQLTKVDRFVVGVGCNAGYSVTSASINGKQVLVFHSKDGWYAFDGTPNVVKLSNSIQQKYTSGSSTTRWNETRFSSIVGTWFPNFNWVLSTISDGGSGTNNYVVIKDMSRPFQTTEGIGFPHWPLSSVPASVITVAKISNNQIIYFGNNSDNKIYKFDPSIFNRASAAYTASYKSKVMDLVENHIVQEFNVRSDEQSSTTSITAYLNMQLNTGDGTSGSADMIATADVLDSTFILDTSQLAGREFIFKNIQTTDYGRFMQFKFQNATADEELIVYGVNFVTNRIGVDPNL